MKGTLYPEYIKKIIPAIPKTVLLFTPFTVTRFAMHRKTNLLVTSTRSSVCCANLTLGFSVNFVHKKHLTERYQWTATNKLKKWPRSNFHLENPIQIIPHFLRMTGLEPARRKHQNLNLARLPIPPHPHIYYLKNRNALIIRLPVLIRKWSIGDSNPGQLD